MTTEETLTFEFTNGLLIMQCRNCNCNINFYEEDYENNEELSEDCDICYGCVVLAKEKEYKQKGFLKCVQCKKYKNPSKVNDITKFEEIDINRIINKNYRTYLEKQCKLKMYSDYEPLTLYKESSDQFCTYCCRVQEPYNPTKRFEDFNKSNDEHYYYPIPQYVMKQFEDETGKYWAVFLLKSKINKSPRCLVKI